MSTVRFGGVPQQKQEPGFSIPAPAAAAALPTIQDCHPWLYAHYPSRWRVMDGELVPDVHKISLQPGVNGAGQEYDDTGAGNPHAAVLDAQRRGAVVFTDTSLGGQLGDDICYLRRVRCKKGHAWLEHCSTPIAGSSDVRIDKAAELSMLRMMRGMVADPDPHILEAEIARCERDHAAAYAEADRNPIQARHAEQLNEELQVWRAALDQSTTTPKIPKTSTRRPRSSKPAAEE